MKNEKWDDVHGNTTPDDRMVAFLESPTDSYAILQLREDVDDNPAHVCKLQLPSEERNGA